jgi:YVTN family beta-propeller protein
MHIPTQGKWFMALAGSAMVAAGFSNSHQVSAHSHHSISYQVQHTWTDVGPTPHFAGVDMRLNKLFVSNLAHGSVTVVNAKTGQQIGTIHIGGTLHTVMVDQKTSTVYVTDIQRGLVDVINAKTDQVEKQINVGGHPHGLAVSQRLHEAFVSNIGLNSVQVINLKTNKVIKTIPVGPNPWGVTVNPRTDTIYAANTGINPFATSKSQQVNPNGDSITIINGKNFTVEKTLPVGPHPWNIIANPSTHTVYTGVSGANEVAMIQHQRVVKDIGVGHSPHGIALDRQTHRLFVNDSLSNEVSIINTRTNQVQQTLPTGKQPQGIAVNKHTGTVYAINQAGQSATVLEPTKSSKQEEISRLIKKERHLATKLASIARQIAHLQQ